MEIAPLFPYYHLDGAEMITYYITSDKNNFLILFCLLVIRWSCLVLLGVKGIRVPDLCILFVTHGLSKAQVESAGDLLDAWEEYFTLYSGTDYLCISHSSFLKVFIEHILVHITLEKTLSFQVKVHFLLSLLSQ